MAIAGQRCRLKGQPGKNHPCPENKVHGRFIAVSPGIKYYNLLTTHHVNKEGRKGWWVLFYKRISKDEFEYYGAEIDWTDEEEAKAFNMTYAQVVEKYGSDAAEYLMRSLKI